MGCSSKPRVPISRSAWDFLGRLETLLEWYAVITGEQTLSSLHERVAGLLWAQRSHLSLLHAGILPVAGSRTLSQPAWAPGKVLDCALPHPLMQYIWNTVRRPK